MLFFKSSKNEKVEYCGIHTSHILSSHNLVCLDTIFFASLKVPATKLTSTGSFLRLFVFLQMAALCLLVRMKDIVDLNFTFSL